MVADLQLDRAQRCAEVLEARQIDAWPLKLDVSDPAQCRALIDAVDERYGRLDALINNAAIDVTVPLAELQIEDWQRVLAVNLFGPLVLAKYALPLLARGARVGATQGVLEGGGHIVNIASTASKRAWPNASVYHATKWGLLGMSHALHAELRVQGVRVCAVVAGGMKTPFLLDRFPDIDQTRLQEPQHVARAVRYVLQPPPGTSIPELMVLPQLETSWP